MQDGLYHREVYWLPQFNKILERFNNPKIEIAKHLKDKIRTAENRIFDIEDINMDIIRNGWIFEVEVEKGKIKKFVTRTKYTSTQDICMAFLIKGKNLFCKTCWTNTQDDIHNTLDETRYVQGDVNEVHNSMEVSIFDLLNNKE